MKKIIPYILPLGYGFISAIFTVSALNTTALVLSPLSSRENPIQFMTICLSICAVCLTCLIFMAIYNFKLFSDELADDESYKNCKSTLIIEFVESAIFFFAFVPAVIIIFRSLIP